MKPREKNRNTAIIMDLYFTSLHVIRSLGRKGVDVIGIDKDPKSIGLKSRYLNRFHCHEDDDDLLEILKEIRCSDKRPPVLFPLGDEYVCFIANYAEELQKHQFLLPYKNDHNLSKNVSKEGINELLTDFDIPRPATFRLMNINKLAHAVENLRFPIIIKPNYHDSWENPEAEKIVGSGNRVVRVEETKELRQFSEELIKFDNIILQEFIPGPSENLYYYVGYRNRAGKIVVSFASRKLRTFPDGLGSETLSEPVYDEELLKIGDSILGKMDYTGPIGVDLKYDPRDSKYKVIEMNFRIGLTDGLLMDRGINLPYIYYKDALGQTTEKITAIRNAIVWYWFDKDVDWFRENKFKNKVTFKDWIRNHFNKSHSFAVYAKDDIMPALYCSVGMLKRYLKGVLTKFFLWKRISLTILKPIISIFAALSGINIRNWSTKIDSKQYSKPISTLTSENHSESFSLLNSKNTKISTGTVEKNNLNGKTSLRIATDKTFWLILGCGLLIRLFGIWNAQNTDEYNEVFEALRVCSGSFNYERWFKRVYLYLLSIEYGIYYILGWLTGIFSNPMDFAEKIVRNMEVLFVMGRITSAIAGTGTVALLYKIGTMFYNKRIAVASSLLLTFTVFHIELSQLAKVDALLGFLVLSTIFFILKILNQTNHHTIYFGLCGLFMALSIQTKINVIILGVPFVVVILAKFRQGMPLSVKQLLIFGAGFSVGFLIGNPPVIFAPGKFISALLGFQAYSTPINVIPNDLVGFLAYPLYFCRAVGPVVSFLTLFSILFAIRFLTLRRLVLLSFIVPFFIAMGATKNMVADYYLIPLIPPLYILIAEFADYCLTKLTVNMNGARRWFDGIAFRSILAAVVLAFPVYKATMHSISVSGPNTRIVAKRWIENHIPPGSRILMDSGKSINSFGPAIAEDEETLKRMISRTKKNLEKGRIVHGMVDSEGLLYFKLLLKTVPDKSYKITSTMFGLDVRTIDYYKRRNFDYIIISNQMRYNRTRDYVREKMPDVYMFYQNLDLDEHLELVKFVQPTIFNHGDGFLIYKII